MERRKAQEFLKSIFGRDDDAAAFSRRDTLAALGLAALLVATPKLLGSSPAEAKPLDKPAENKATGNQEAEEGAADLSADDSADVTDLSSQYWRRRRRPYWRRRRYWRRRYWRPYVRRRRRYWRRRYWRRRY